MIKLFISYSHPDAKHVEAFMRFIGKHLTNIYSGRRMASLFLGTAYGAYRRQEDSI